MSSDSVAAVVGSPESGALPILGPFLMPLSLRALVLLLPLGLPRFLLTVNAMLLTDDSDGPNAGWPGGGVAAPWCKSPSTAGNISASQLTKSEPEPLTVALCGKSPSLGDGGGAPGMPPKYARALHSWSTTRRGCKLRNRVSRRACSALVSCDERPRVWERMLGA